jgi:hypothetical protein
MALPRQISFTWSRTSDTTDPSGVATSLTATNDMFERLEWAKSILLAFPQQAANMLHELGGL